MVLEDQNSIGSQAWEDRNAELDSEIARHEAQIPEPAGEELRGHGNDLGGFPLPVGSAPPPAGTSIVVGGFSTREGEARTAGDAGSGICPPAANFPPNYRRDQAAFVLGVSEDYLHWLIDRDHCTTLTTLDGVEFISQPQLDRLDDWLARTELELRLVTA